MNTFKPNLNLMSSYTYFPSLCQYRSSMGNCFTGRRGEGTQIDDLSLNVDTTTVSDQGALTGMEEIMLNNFCNHLLVLIKVNYSTSAHIQHRISLTIIVFLNIP